MRRLKFWSGYLHLSPGYGIRISGPVGSMMWETGSCRLRNIGTGLMVFVGVNLVVQPCSVMEVRGLERPTLGKRKGTRGEKGISDKL